MSRYRKLYNPFFKLHSTLITSFGCAAILGLFSANPMLTLACILVVPVFMTLLWRQGEPPVLLFAVLFQWLQVSAQVFYANMLGVRIETISYGPEVGEVVVLSLIGLLVLAVGMRISLNKLKSKSHSTTTLDGRYSLVKLFILCLVVVLLNQMLQRYAFVLASLTQILLALLQVKWVFIFMLGYLVLKRKEKYYYFAIIFLIEFVGGIGFFSGFKTILFLTLIIIFTVYHTLSLKTLLNAGVIGVTLIFLALTWTSIKGEYRSFLNQNSGQQEVVVSRSDRLTRLITLVGELDLEDYQEASSPLFERIAYVNYFTAAVGYVPTFVPHTEGDLWQQAVLHVLRPRILFPNKPVLLSDSELTMRYTGLLLGSGSQGTSISMGYMAESYIDFGRYGMFAPVFAIGLLWGFMYYYFMSRATVSHIGYSFATALLINAYQFEMASIKLLGGILVKFFVLALFFHVIMPYVSRWLCEENNQVTYAVGQVQLNSDPPTKRF